MLKSEKLRVPGPGWLLSSLTLFAAACLACILAANPVRSADGVSSSDVDNGEKPVDRTSALALIARTTAGRDAERLAVMEKNLTPVESEWGIKMLGLRLTAAGYALDFRYTVLDPVKAAPLLNRSFNFRPVALVEKSGAKLGVPFTEKAGALRSSVSTPSQIKQGRNYSVLFANPGKHAGAGDEITIVIGDFVVKHVVLE